MITAAIYSRVSTDDQTKGYSPQTQVETCLKYAQEHGYAVPGEYIFMEHYTGASLERPELNRLRQLAASGAIAAVFVLDLDRLSRKAVYQMLIEEEFEKYNAPIQYVNSQYENTPEGNLQKQIRATLAEFERAKFKERSLRGKRGRAQAGYVAVGRTAPYGYHYVKGERKGWLEVFEDEAMVVRMIFGWYVHGDHDGKRMGAASIARRLTDMGVPTKKETNTRPGRMKEVGAWSISMVKQLLRREAYAGVWVYNQTKATGKTTRVTRPHDEWIRVQVPAIIPRELWEAAQKQRVENTIHAKRNTKRVYMMQTRLRCSVCGYIFRARADDRRAHRPLSYYYCGGQKLARSADWKTKTCHRSLKQDVWDERIWVRIAAVLKDPGSIVVAMEEQQAEVEAELSSVRERLASVEKKIEAVDQKRKKLLDLFLDEATPMSKEILSAKAKDLAQERAMYEQEAAELRSRLQAAANPSHNIERVQLFCQQVAQGIDLFSDEDKKWVISVLDVTGTVRRGTTPAEDVIKLTGYIPEMDVEMQEGLGGGIARGNPVPAGIEAIPCLSTEGRELRRWPSRSASISHSGSTTSMWRC
jgi:site-specific DNA recombinase